MKFSIEIETLRKRKDAEFKQITIENEKQRSQYETRIDELEDVVKRLT
jgi:hypothetical protein